MPSDTRASFSLGRAALVVRNVARTLRLAWDLDRTLTLQYLMISLVDALLPVGIAYVGKEIVDGVMASIAAREHPLHRVLVWVGVELAMVVGKLVSGQTSGYLSTLLRARLAVHVDVLIFRKALALSIRHFEDPEFMNRLERARKESSWRPVEIITHGFTLGKNAVTLLGYGALLVQFSVWAAVALALASLPFLAEMTYAGEQYALKTARTQDERQSGYLQSLLTSDWYAKEIKLFGIGPLLVDRYQALNQKFLEEDRRFAWRRGLAVTLLGALSSLTFYAIYGWVVARTVVGAITLGSMTLYLTVFRQGQSAFQGAMSTLARTYEDNLYMNNLYEYLAIPDDDVATPRFDTPSLASGPPEIRFDHVSFQYPGSERAALEDVSLTLRAGETVALVGPNAAGKTTLVKLLTGLHEATSGTITVGGEDVRAMDRGALRSRIGVVFQDFVHYHFTAADNVGIGWVPAMSDRAAVEEAARQSGAAEVIESLPEAYDTMLGRWFGGEQLSVGQWQRVALARAFVRKSDVLILDEPTAAIDAEGEHEVFERFRQLKADRTALLITHRFGTVRMADRIVVFDGGRLVEEGTHDALMALGGLYARMFSLQAAGYREAGGEG